MRNQFEFDNLEITCHFKLKKVKKAAEYLIISCAPHNIETMRALYHKIDEKATKWMLFYKNLDNKTEIVGLIQGSIGDHEAFINQNLESIKSVPTGVINKFVELQIKDTDVKIIYTTIDLCNPNELKGDNVIKFYSAYGYSMGTYSLQKDIYSMIEYSNFNKPTVEKYKTLAANVNRRRLTNGTFTIYDYNNTPCFIGTYQSKEYISCRQFMSFLEDYLENQVNSGRKYLKKDYHFEEIMFDGDAVEINYVKIGNYKPQAKAAAVQIAK